MLHKSFFAIESFDRREIMKKSLIALALVGAFSAPVFAEEAAAPAADAGPHTLTANVGLFSEYRFRGIAQTAFRPAIQGGFDYSHSSGFYVGNWNSNVDPSAGYPGGNIEMDFYGGYKAAFGDFGLDVGGIFYYYPGSSVNGGKNNGDVVTNKEV
ncbi:MAG TPA: TorF family putative porin, partial [Azonexus sp.]|nr:TorF family putative porin [Azonexus sp.]